MRIYPRKNAPWTAREINQLGKVPDSVLARRTQRTIKEVVPMLEHRRIFLPTPPRRWTAHEIRMLGRYADRELARRLRRPRKQIRDERIRLRIAPFPLDSIRYAIVIQRTNPTNSVDFRFAMFRIMTRLTWRNWQVIHHLETRRPYPTFEIYCSSGRGHAGHLLFSACG